MKICKNARKLSGLTLTLVMMLILFMWNGVEAKADIIENVSVSNVQKHENGSLKSFDLEYFVGYPSAQTPSPSAASRVAVQTRTFDENSDFTEYGNYARNHTYDNWPDVPADCDFVTWGKVENGYTFIRSATGSEDSITVTFEEDAIDLNTAQTYYVYIWTNYVNTYSDIYPDAYVYEFTAGQGDFTGSTTPNTYYIDIANGNGKLYEDALNNVEVPANRTLKYGDTVKSTYEGSIKIYCQEMLDATLALDQNYSIPDGKYTYSISGDNTNGFELRLTRVTSGSTPVNPGGGGNSTPQPNNTNQSTSDTHTHNFQWVVTKQPTEKTDGCNSLMCTGCGAVEATQPISYFNNITNNVMKEFKEAPNKGTITIDDEFLRCFSNEMVEELLARPDLTVVVNFTDKGVNYSFTIPAGKAPTDGQEWYGYYYLGSVYGWTLMENVL